MGVAIANGDLRVHDFLEDKLQTAADLDSLDALLDNVRTQHALLEQQLHDARRESSDFQAQASTLSSTLHQEMNAFKQHQSELDRTLMIVTQSDSTDDAIRRMEPIMQSLHRLDLAKHYLELVEIVQALGVGCIVKTATEIDQAIDDYDKIVLLSSELRPLQEHAEGAAPHLVDLVSSTSTRVRRHLVTHLAAQIEVILTRIGWPKARARVPADIKSEWEAQAGRLLRLQKYEQTDLVRSNMMRQSKLDPTPLILLEVLIKPLAMRFQYHFSGDKMTNRLDKPEYFLNHVLELVDEYHDFLQEHIQPLLVKHFAGTDAASIPAYVDATSAWINALMPILYRKLEKILPEAVRQPGLFSNLVHEVMAFDVRLLDEWNYAPLSPDLLFRGLSYHVLSTMGYFPAWFSVERDFALSRYEAIISDRSTGEIDYDGVDQSLTKPTKAAMRVNDLLESITDQYRSLASFHQKLKFLIEIQIAVFDRFHGRLSEGLEAYITRTSTVGRTVHGGGKSDGDVTGAKGLDRLCRVFGSAEYLEKSMQDWSEDVFFLDLWQELQIRSANDGRFKEGLRIEDIRAKTSTAAAATGLADREEELQGALFDETAASYHRLRVRSEQVLVDTVTYDIRSSLRAYSRVETWASMSASAPAATVPGSAAAHNTNNPTTSLAFAALTAELDAPLRQFNEYLSFLHRALGRASLRHIVRRVSLDLQSYLWGHVLISHAFSTSGAAQLANDVAALFATVDRHVGARSGAAFMLKLSEGLKLLCLPVKATSGGGDGGGGGGEGAVLGLWEVERRLFASNEEAREVLDDLGLEAVTAPEARDVIKRRIEVAS